MTGDEVLSDSYPIVLLDDIVFEVQAKMITKTESGDYNIGANASAEGGGGETDEGFDASSVTVNNIVDAHNLQQTTFDKKSYMAYIKNYMQSIKKKLEENNPERVKIFQEKAQVFIKKILENFKDYDFFVSENGLEGNGHCALLFYKEDGIIPYFYYFKDGLGEEKV